MYRPTIYVAVLAVLTGCGFQPLYGSAGQVDIGAELASIKIDVIKDRIGQQLRNHLLDSINPLGPPGFPAYTLSVTLKESKQELAVKKSAITTRVNISFSAAFTLRGTKRDSPVQLTGTSMIVTGYNILTSDFATLTAAQDARTRAVRELGNDITNRIAAFIQMLHGRGT